MCNHLFIWKCASLFRWSSCSLIVTSLPSVLRMNTSVRAARVTCTYQGTVRANIKIHGPCSSTLPGKCLMEDFSEQILVPGRKTTRSTSFKERQRDKLLYISLLLLEWLSRCKFISLLRRVKIIYK